MPDAIRGARAILDALRFDAKERPKLVHRLDRDTSGALVLARSARAAATLMKTFSGKTAEKTYWALVKGVPNTDADDMFALSLSTRAA